MDNKAFYKLSYGVFVLTTKAGNKENGCVTNTCIQVASNPTRVAISCLNTNYTCDLIKESGVFALSSLIAPLLLKTSAISDFRAEEMLIKSGPLICQGI